MSRQGVPMRRELTAAPRPKPAAPEPYRYTVDGEKLTLDEIVARCAPIQAQTVKRRVTLQGMRTWRDLQRPPIAGARMARRKLARSIRG